MQVWLTYFDVHDPWRPLHALTSCTVDPFCWRRGALGLKSVDCSQDESKTHPISPTCNKHALKTFLLHVLFTRFFFNCQGVAKQQAEYAKIDEAESRRIEWIHRQEIKGPKPEVPGIVRSLWEAGSGFLEMKWMYIYISVCVCVVALIYWCSCFPRCFLNFARLLFHVYIDCWQEFLTIVRLQWKKTVNLWMISQKIIVFMTLMTHNSYRLIPIWCHTL